MLHNQFIRQLGIAGLSLLAASAIYIFTRASPPALLSPFTLFDGDYVSRSGVFGSAPSFLYTLAICLVIGAIAASYATARNLCLVWVVLALLLELSQAQAFAVLIVDWLTEYLPANLLAMVESYWARGTLDPLDLLATLLGGSAALVYIQTITFRENRCA